MGSRLPAKKLVVLAVGIAAEIAVQVPFVFLGHGPFVGSISALPVAIACLVGFLAGPVAGAVVALSGWVFFFPFVVDGSPFALVALVLWAVPAVLVGIVAQRLHERERELAVFEAERRYEELRSDLANQAHHEVRTPAAVIVGMADVLQREEFDLTPEQRQKFLALIAESARRLTDVSTRLEGIEPNAELQPLHLLKLRETP